MNTNISQSLTTITAVVFVAIVVLVLLSRCINILRQYERGVVFRLGRVMQERKRARAWCSSSGRSTSS